MVVRPLMESDLAQALELSGEAGWNQLEADWLRLLRLSGSECLCVEDSGRVCSTATLVRYGNELGWIGMVLTRMECRRRGYARMLLEELLKQAPRLVKLDGTDEGRPLYESLGFVVEQPIERWRREPQPSSAATPLQLGQPDLALDREAFGADRSELLAGLGEPWTAGEAYAYSRPGAHACYFGPCVSKSAGRAMDLARWIIAANGSQPWCWDLLPQHTGAEDLARRLGFEPVRRLVRMRRGPESRRNDALVYAIAGFEVG